MLNHRPVHVKKSSLTPVLCLTPFFADNANALTPLDSVNAYDAIGRLTLVTDPDGNWVLSTYDDPGRPTLVEARIIHDGALKPDDTALTDHIFVYDYDGLGRIIEQKEADAVGDLITTFGYDHTVGERTTTDPEGTVRIDRSDQLGRRLSMTEDPDPGLDRVTLYHYDRLGRLVKKIANDGTADQTTEYVYDLVGRRTEFVYPDGTVGTDSVTLAYDKAGRLTTRTDQRGIEVSFDYDNRGLLTKRSVGSELEDTYTHDGLGRMKTAIRKVGSPLAEIAESVFNYDYNDLGHLGSETQELFGSGTARQMNYTYDQAGNRTGFTYPSGVACTLTYSHDALNRVDVVSRDEGSGPVSIIDYDYAGQYLDRRRLATDYVSCAVHIDYEPGYDEFRRLSNIRNRVATPGCGALLSDNDYVYDGVGNLLTVTADPSASYFAAGLQKNFQYGYDTLHRLEDVDYLTDVETESFVLDKLGNRESHTRRDETVVAYAHNPANEYTRIGTPLPGVDNIVHDLAGNLTGDELGLGYEYDFENRLVKILDDQQVAVAEYTYDALGRRIASTVDQETLHFYYDNQNVVAEYDVQAGAESLRRYYIHGSQYIDERAVMHDAVNDADYYYFQRELWSVEGLVNDRGHEVERYTYDAYGRPTVTIISDANMNCDGVVNIWDMDAVWDKISQPPCDEGEFYDIVESAAIDIADWQSVRNSGGPAYVPSPVTGIGNPYAFTGRRLDEIESIHLSLYHYRARAYDPLHGRFMQRDPAGYVDGMNLYEYARGNPNKHRDPQGLCCECCCVERLDLRGVIDWKKSEIGSFWGHTLGIRGELTYHDPGLTESPKLEGCRMYWWEYTTLLGESEMTSKGQTTYLWQEWYSRFPGAAAFKDWRELYDPYDPYEDDDCDGKTLLTVAFNDRAIINQTVADAGVSRELYIGLKIVSTPGCNCKNKVMNIKFHQGLSLAVDGTGRARSLTVLSAFPHPVPGNPPGAW